MIDIFTDCDDSTPLTEEEKNGLKAKWVTRRGELNELETQGIIKSEIWLMSTSKRNILSESFIKALHKKIFGDVWVWAGKFRTTEKNIGIRAYKIQKSLKVLLDYINYWISNNTFSKKEITFRLHHRLVKIHPFPNGNGKTSRLMADLFMQKSGATRLC